MSVPSSIFGFLVDIVFVVVIFQSKSIKSINDFFRVILIIPELLDFSVSFPSDTLFLVEVVSVDYGTDL